jgi:cysteinyl-tRNA synthetase
LKEKGFDPSDFRYLCLMAHYRSKMNFTWQGLESAKRTLQGIRQLMQRNDPGDQNQKEAITQALYDDLDTPQALGLLHEAKSSLLWQAFDPILGLSLTETKEVILSQEALDLLKERTAARAKHDWTEADRIRQQLTKLGYKVVDSSGGSKLELF